MKQADISNKDMNRITVKLASLGKTEIHSKSAVYGR